MEPVIRVRNLRKTFRTPVKRRGLGGFFANLFAPEMRTVHAVDGISFQVERGEMLAFIGPNGAGKSTTIKIITGILHPDAPTGEKRELSVLGFDPQRDRKRLSYRIGTVFGQKSQLWFHLPPLDSLKLLADIYDVDRASAERRIDFLTEVFEIGDYLHTPVRKLSLGERIRCEIAASLLHQPEVLFLDEPTIGLDVVVKQRIRDLILRVNEEERATVFLTSHDVGDMEKICRRVIVINHGRVVLDDSVKTLKYSFANRKIVDLKLEAPLHMDLGGVRVVKTKEYSAKLEIDLAVTTMEAAIQHIVGRNRIVDITVSDPPMEEVIAEIYARRPGTASS